jgi:LysM repeat protein
MGRKVSKHENNINYIIAKKGDDYGKIAQDLNLGRWQILKYNDLSKKDPISEGDIIFIQPKHSKSKTNNYVAKSGDTWWSVSQKFGVKLKKLLKRNGVEEGQELKPGEKVKLR